MNRILYVSSDKIFSIRSPFNIKKVENELIFYTKCINSIENRITSEVLACINDDRFESTSTYTFLESLEENVHNIEETWSLIRELMVYEDGYIRFDHDPEHDKGRLHPLNHLDVCYTTASTFKVGTYQRPCFDYFLQLLDNTVESKHLEAT